LIRTLIVLNRARWNARLCRLFTGCYAYHAGFVDLGAGKLYDMNLIRRRRCWPHYAGDATVELELYPAPCVTREYLEDRLDRDAQNYGAIDYALFAARPVNHAFGRPTRNAGGVICSEMVNDDLRACGVETPWGPMDAPPSPCDLRRWLARL
jgi:hypothetical protein